MSKEKHSYNISLDVSSSAASKQVLKELQTAFANSNEDMDALNDSFKTLLKNTKDVEAAEKQYNKVVEKSLADRAKQIDHVGKLNIDHVAAFEKELEEAWVDTGVVSPKLFPSYKASFRTYLNTSFSSDKEDY